jgi:hypothetical protein
MRAARGPRPGRIGLGSRGAVWPFSNHKPVLTFLIDPDRRLIAKPVPRKRAISYNGALSLERRRSEVLRSPERAKDAGD